MAIAPPLVFAFGVLIVCASFGTAIRTFMLAGSGGHLVTWLIFRSVQRMLSVAARLPRTERGRRALLSLYAPVSLLLVYASLLLLNGVGFAFMFYALGQRSVVEAMVDSGSALSTLGFSSFHDLPPTILSVVEALMTTTMAALLIGYLPTITAAYLDRERAIVALEAEVGPVDSGVAILEEYGRPDEIERLGGLWGDWARWFVDLGKSHASLSGALFVRSPGEKRPWVTVAGSVLDAAALASSAFDAPVDRAADRCLRAGAGALRDIAASLEFIPDEAVPGDAPITVTRADFDAAWERLAAVGAPLVADRDAAWAAFAEARGGYEAPLLAVCRATLTQPGGWG